MVEPLEDRWHLSAVGAEPGPTVNLPPVISALLANVSEVGRPGVISFSPSGVSDPDGTVVALEFYRDSDGDGLLDVAGDQLLGLDSVAANGWFFATPTSGFPAGVSRFFAVARDDAGALGDPASTTVTILNRPPNIGGLGSLPNIVLRPANLTLSANGAGDADGQVVTAEFYLDADGDGLLDPELDDLLGVDLDGSDGWGLVRTSTGIPAGNARYFARVMDNEGAWSAAVTATGTVQNQGPSISSLAATPADATRLDAVVLTVAASDPDGAVAAYEIYRDSNDDGYFDLFEDERIATSSSLTLAPGELILGTHRFFARVLDADNRWSAEAAVLVSVANVPPELPSLTVNATVIPQGNPLLIRADAMDADGAVASVSFYLDIDGNGQLDTAVDALIGADASPAGGWTWKAPTRNLPLGPHRLLALATDDNGGTALAALDFTITPPITATATLAKPIPPKLGDTRWRFTITYTDPRLLAAATIGHGDVEVVGKGFSVRARLLRKVVDKKARVVTAVYVVVAPKGQWDPSDNGAYTIRLLDNQVADSLGRFLPGKKLGVLKVGLVGKVAKRLWA